MLNGTAFRSLFQRGRASHFLMPTPAPCSKCDARLLGHLCIRLPPVDMWHLQWQAAPLPLHHHDCLLARAPMARVLHLYHTRVWQFECSKVAALTRGVSSGCPNRQPAAARLPLPCVAHSFSAAALASGKMRARINRRNPEPCLPPSSACSHTQERAQHAACVPPWYLASPAAHLASSWSMMP